MKTGFFDYTLKLGNFGISRQLKYDSEYATTFCGTKPYMAHEILNCEPYKKEDIYSFGCFLFHLLTLRLYFFGTT